jgi:hypothetical protein
MSVSETFRGHEFRDGGLYPVPVINKQPDMIVGTRVPNTEAGVQALTRSILKQERDRVRRNSLRARGDYSTDLNAAQATLDEIDQVLTHDLDHGDLSAAHEAVSQARQKGFTLGDGLIQKLMEVRDNLAAYSAALATQVIALDTSIRNIQNGEAEA